VDKDPVVEVAKPALHLHNGEPLALFGQRTGAQELVKKGAVLVACTDPAKP